MASFEDRGDAVKALHRMIVYARKEAARLRIADAVLLLGYAEDALTTPDLPCADERPFDDWPRDPIVQH